uniref:Putative glycosyltransferase n=1 Tax=viral metagenome TaxID=1070528 RepID=A0A6M3J2E4_9ZZZZ
MKILIVVRDMLKVGKHDLIGHYSFVKEFENHCDVVWWGPLHDGYDENRLITDVVKEHCPDVLFKYGFRMPFEIDIDKVKIPKMIYLVDYFPPKGLYKGVQPQYQEYMEKANFDVAFVPVSYMERYVVECGACKEAVVIPFSVNTNIFKKLSVHKKYDVCARYILRDDVYPFRSQIKDILLKMNVASVHGKTSVDKYVTDINSSKIVVTSNNIFGSLSMKYTETMSCGSFLLADKPEDLKRFRYVDGEHLVIYRNLNDLKDKIYYYLKHGDERERIAKQGMDFVRENYSNYDMISLILFYAYIKWGSRI